MQGGSITSRAVQDRARMAVLDEADIVCSTLSYSGSGTFTRMSRGFDIVVIDEAAQAVEPSTLIPLVSGARQVSLHAPLALASPHPPCALARAPPRPGSSTCSPCPCLPPRAFPALAGDWEVMWAQHKMGGA